MSGADLGWMSASEASGLIAARKLSPVEYVEALLARIAAHDSKTHAFIGLTADAARADAKVAEAEIAAGKWRGPLHGIPYGLKDIVDYAGLRTTGHSKVLKDSPPATEDAVVTAKLRAAGGVHLGKLATHEFAIGGPSHDLPWPAARNPWNTGHHPGGSSSGSGAALAAGLLPLALGSDTGGSIRNPASMCGIVGMKATYGRVSRRGVFPLSFSLDHVGPMTRTVADNAMLLNAIAGHDAGDPGSANEPMEDFARDLGRGVKGLKVGIVRHFHQRDMVADPEMTAAIDLAADTLRSLGATLEEVTLAPLQEYAAVNRAILLSEAYAIHERWLRERPGDYGQLARQRVMGGAFVRGVDYVQAVRRKAMLVAGINAVLARVDVLLVASSMEPACRIDDPAEIERTYPRQARTPFNLTGHPALAMGGGFHSNGLPLAFQIAGRPFGEATIYRVAAACEGAHAWHEKRPPGFG